MSPESFFPAITKRWRLSATGPIISPMILTRCVLVLLLIALGCFGLKLVYRSRALAMRQLALKWGFQYTECDPHLWFPHFWYSSHGDSPLPASLGLSSDPEDASDDLMKDISRTWNVIEGKKDGVDILIFDGVVDLGVRRGRFSTFIAARADQNPFEDKKPEEIVYPNDWVVLYCFRILPFVPWTLSIRRIEEHLNNLKT
jgi:hypothetical protein